MKVAVYTIAKNEEQFAKRWADTTKDADLRLVGDTGSADLTVHRLKMFGVEVIRNMRVDPWDFALARNTVLSLLPDDIDWCIVLDMDEVLHDGWRDCLEDSGTRKSCLYHWQGGPLQRASEEERPNVSFMDDRRVHRRFGYQWRFPCHEELWSYGGNEDRLVDSSIVFEHLPDHTKPRSGYFDLLRNAATDYPWAARMAFYFGRELASRGAYDEAVDLFRRCSMTQLQGLLAETLGGFGPIMAVAR